jgi:hypothetical protein
MSMGSVLFDGVRRAATYTAMLFSFQAAPPAMAQSPAAAPPAVMAIDASVADSGLTLVAHHVDAHMSASAASVRTLLLLRNDGPDAVSVHYVLPDPARVVIGDAINLPGRDAVSSLCDEQDLSVAQGERAETAPGSVVHRNDVIVVPAGEQVTVQVQRELPVVVAGGVHRLALPLAADRDAPWVPRFTADVLVEADRPIRRLSSPTHPVLVDGLGENTALLSIEDGFVHRQRQLTVEFELGAAPARAPVAALEPTPVRQSR